MEKLNILLKFTIFEQTRYLCQKLPLRSSSGHLLIHPTIYGRKLSRGLIFSNFWFYSPSKSTSLVTINDCVYMGLNSHQWREEDTKKDSSMGVGGFVWHLHHSCQCHQFSPINLHNCQFDGKFKNNIIIIIFFVKMHAGNSKWRKQDCQKWQ